MMNIEQMKQIVEGAPEGDRSHIDSLGFYHENDAHNLSDLRTIIAQAEEIQQLRERLGKIESLWDECGRWPDTSSDIAALDEVIYQARAVRPPKGEGE